MLLGFDIQKQWLFGHQKAIREILLSIIIISIIVVILRKEEEQCACWPLPKTVQETDQEDSIHWVICKTFSLTKEEELYWPLPKIVQETDRKNTIHWVIGKNFIYS